MTITLAAAATAELSPTKGLYYDIQMATPAGVYTLTYGTLNVTADITRAIA